MKNFRFPISKHGIFLPVILFLLIGLSAQAQSFDESLETLAKQNLFSKEFIAHDSSWLAKRIDRLLQHCFSITDADKRTIVIESVGLRLDEFALSPENEIFLSQISASSYITIHRKIAHLFVDYPERVQRIESLMMEAWPNSPVLDLNTVRKYFFLVGLHKENPSREWGLEPKTMLMDFKEKHFNTMNMAFEKAALLFFNVAIGKTMSGSVSLSKTEIEGFKSLLELIHNPASTLAPNTLEALCRFFLRNI